MDTPPRSAHLILVGLPGAGKSTVGGALARRLGLPFLDFDPEIERRAGASVTEIFRGRGEEAFRAMELALTRELATRPPMVLAPGGGWVAIPGAMALLRPPARMIYLRVRPDVALLRMGQERRARPLLENADPLAAIRRLLAAREGAYLSADHVVDVDDVGIEELTAYLARLAEGRMEG